MAPSARSDTIGRGKGGVIAPSLGGHSIRDGPLESDFDADLDEGKDGKHTEVDDTVNAAPDVVLGSAGPAVVGGIYFQSWIVNMVDIKIDYSPKQVRGSTPARVDYSLLGLKYSSKNMCVDLVMHMYYESCLL